MPTTSSSTTEVTGPTDAQLHVLTLVHEGLPAKLQRSALEVANEFRHWEDEYPSGAYASFQVQLDAFDVFVGTPFSWEGRSDVIVVRFATYSSGDAGENTPPWAVHEDGATQQRLQALGCKRWGGSHSWQVMFAVDTTDPSEIARAVATTIEHLAEIRFRVLRPADLDSPPNWPQALVFDLLAADELHAERATPNAEEWRVRFSLNGVHRTAQIPDDMWRFACETRERLTETRSAL